MEGKAMPGGGKTFRVKGEEDKNNDGSVKE
jgi:hypothetical protein